MCESSSQQFRDDGTLVVDSVTGTHVGVFQLSKQWQNLANTFGLDVVNSEKDNITMAIWIFNKLGTQPWLASKNCWSHYAINKSNNST